MVHSGGDWVVMWLVVYSGGDCGWWCIGVVIVRGDCGWWCIVVVIVRGDMVNVVGGASCW